MTTTQRTRRTQRTWTMDERRERSLELADERGGGMWAVRCVETETEPFGGELTRLQVEVTSAHDESKRYLVIYDPELDMAFCICLSAEHLAPCWHAGQAIRYGRYTAEALSPAGRAADEREAYLNWINEPPSPEY
jgi:hypothetical protein